MNAPFRPAPTTLESAVRVVGQQSLIDQLRTIQDIAEGKAFGVCCNVAMENLDSIIRTLIEDAEYEDNRLAALITNGRPETRVYL